MGVSSAIIDFNDGTHGVLNVTNEYGLDEGDCCKTQSASREIRTEFKKMDLSVVKVHPSR